MKIGGLNIERIVFLAPLAGVADLTFRQLCTERGCGLTYTEMICAKGITYRNENTMRLLETAPGERPSAVQLFGKEPEVLAEAARTIEHLHYDFIDINMGCPAPKIWGNGEGAALMLEPALAGAIVRSVSRATAKPVTVKIRKGPDGTRANAVEIARVAEDAGAAAVAVHGRFRDQYYSGAADWDVIARVKESVMIPVIGNGDVDGPESAANLLRQTGCDAVMVGRAAMGDPWIFGRISHYLETGRTPPPPSPSEKAALALRHAETLAARKGERTGVLEMRKHLAWYAKGLPHAAQIRRAANGAATLAEIKQVCEALARLP